MKVSIGAKLYLSKLGAYGFHYPNNEKPLTVTATFSAKEVSWVGSKFYSAIIPDDQATAVDSDGNFYRINYPVWVENS
jgi:hypothetical protein